MEQIFNKDGFNWWIGVVEDRLDPEKLGRLRVRVYGYHTDNKELLPTEDLPWAIPIQPINSAAMSGIGTSPVGPLPGTWVIGFFLDGPDMQQPAFFGTIGSNSAPQVFKQTEEKKEVKNINDGYLKDPQGNNVLDSLGNKAKAGVPPVSGWYLGKTSRSYESDGGSVGFVNEYQNSDEVEGARYGIFKLPSYLPKVTQKNKSRPSGKVSPVISFTKFSKFKEEFTNVIPGTSEFDSVWGEIANSDSAAFEADQIDFIRTSFYEVMVSNLKRKGFDATLFGPAVKDLIWSTAYQFGPSKTEIITTPLAGKSELTDKDIVTLVSEYKILMADTYFLSKGSDIVDQNKSRFRSEKSSLLSLITV